MAQRATMRTNVVGQTPTNEQLTADIFALDEFITNQREICSKKEELVETKQKCAKAIGDAEKQKLVIQNELRLRNLRRQIESSSKKGGSKRKTTKGRRKQNKSRRRKSRR